MLLQYHSPVAKDSSLHNHKSHSNRYSYSDKAATKGHACYKVLSTKNLFREI